MSYSKRLIYPVLALGSFTIVLLLYALNWTKSAELSDLPPLLTVAGNLHPLLLHLPIGIFIYLGFAETWNFLDRAWLKRGQIRGDVPILAFGTVTAVFAAFAGLLLYLQGDYSGELIERHMNWGTGFAIGSILVLCSALIFQNDSQIYRLVLFVIIAALTVTGHQGGLITHGDPLEPLFGEEQIVVEAKPIEKVTSYEVVDKIFQAKCYDCHSVGKKKKGGLLMDSYEALLLGGKKGNALVPGSLVESKISTHPHLPLENELHMPPEGKPQLTEEELDFIDAWILSGASANSLLIDQELPRELYNWAITYLETDLVKIQPDDDRIDMPEESRVDLAPLITEIEQYAPNSLSQVGPTGQHLVFSALNGRDTFDDACVAALINAAPYLIEVDLSYTTVSTIAVVELLRRTPQLKRLNLSGTQVGQETVEALATLESLESLILFEAQVAPDAISLLSHLNQLQALYITGTGFSPIQVEQIREALSGVEVVADDFLKKHSPKPTEEAAKPTGEKDKEEEE